MQFTATTKPPAGQMPLKAEKADEIKDLLFRAVKLYVQDNALARQELLDALSEPEGCAEVTS